MQRNTCSQSARSWAESKAASQHCVNLTGPPGFRLHNHSGSQIAQAPDASLESAADHNFDGQEMYLDRGNFYDFTSLVRELDVLGEIYERKTYPFEFSTVEMPHETYNGRKNCWNVLDLVICISSGDCRNTLYIAAICDININSKAKRTSNITTNNLFLEVYKTEEKGLMKLSSLHRCDVMRLYHMILVLNQHENIARVMFPSTVLGTGENWTLMKTMGWISNSRY
ncbi:hypothetical protein OROMI_016355 [Orobanche minor]